MKFQILQILVNRWCGFLASPIILLTSLLCLPTLISAADCGPWEWAHPLPQGEDLSAAAFGFGRFVAVTKAEELSGQNPGTILTSENGVDWSVQDTGVRANLRGVTWGGDRFVAVGNFTATSTDGLSWTTAGYGGLQGVAWDGTKFVGVGSSIATSPDGLNWTQVVGYTNLYDIVWGGGQFVAVGTMWNSIWTSPDGINWQSQEHPYNLYGVSWNGLEYLAVGDDGIVLKSDDAVSWTQVKYDSSQTLEDIVWDGSQYVVVGSTNTGGPGLILTSLDGEDWIEPMGWNRDYGLSGVAVGTGQLLAVGDGGMLLTSPDGDAWQDRLSYGSREILHDLVRGDAGWIAVGEGGTLLSSVDGQEWLPVDSGSLENLYGVHWGDSRYLVVGATGTLLTSQDGETWTLQDNLGTEATLYDAGSNDQLLVLVGAEGTILTSRNSRQWNLQNSNTDQDLNALTWGDELFVAVGNTGTIDISLDGMTWNKLPMVGDPNTNDLTGIVWGGDQYVAVGGHDSWTLGVLSSPDGVKWNWQQSGGWLILSDVTWGDDEFVAVGGQFKVLTSPNGIDWAWEDPTPTTSSNLYGVAWDNHQFIAVGVDGTILRKSCGAGAADLSVSMVDDPDPVTQQSTLSYIIEVINHGPDDASDVMLIDTLPNGVRYQSDTGDCEVDRLTVRCELGDMAADEGVTVMINVRPVRSGNLSNEVVVYADPPNDSDESNNTATEQTRVERK